LAEMTAQYLQKGRLVLVEGDIEARGFADKQGNVRASLELTATTVRFLGGRGDGEASAAPKAAGGEEPPPDEDGIPF